MRFGRSLKGQLNEAKNCLDYDYDYEDDDDEKNEV